MKKVLIEGSIFSRQLAGGISNYLVKLIELGITRNNDPEVQYSVLVHEKSPDNIFWRSMHAPLDIFQFQPPTRFYRRIFSGRFEEASIFHSPYMFLPPKRKATINLLTVHDLINLRQPFSVRAKPRAMMLKLAISRADQFICISNTTRDDVLNSFHGINRDRVHVIHQGIDAIFTGEEAGDEVNLPGKPFLLYVGARDGYKNFQSLLSFYQQSRWRKDMGILCVGGGPFTAAEQAFIDSNNLREQIIHAGFITTRQLKAFYSKAFALVYTSFAEGFGLPILESMASECPVICGNFSSMQEVAGGNAILVEDFSPDSLDAALQRVKVFSSSQREKARDHARQFTWEKTAHNTLALYKSFL